MDYLSPKYVLIRNLGRLQDALELFDCTSASIFNPIEYLTRQIIYSTLRIARMSLAEWLRGSLPVSFAVREGVFVFCLATGTYYATLTYSDLLCKLMSSFANFTLVVFFLRWSKGRISAS